MNDVLQQLLSMGPALGAGASGNGNAMQAFMQGFQKSRQQWEETQRRKQQDDLAMQDRQTAIGRQRTADEEHAQDRARAGVIAGQQDALRTLQLPGQLAEVGSGADTPDDAKRLIESIMPTLMKGFGPEAMAFGQPAVEQATQVITGRQKKQVEAFLESALKIDHIANNPDADPEIVNLPDHIKRVIGRPSARLSELQSFANLPVGRPAKRPADDVSWQPDDVIVGGKLTRVLFNPKTHEYIDQQGQPVVVNPVPPRPPAGPNDNETADLAQQLVDGFLVPSMLSRRGNYNTILAEANRISQRTTGKPYNAARSQTEYAASQRFMTALNGPQQQRFRALAGSVVNTIDEVKTLSQEMKNSGVPLMNRVKLAAYSQAMGNTPQGQLAAQYLGAVNTLKEEFANLANGGYAPTEAAWGLANQQINGDFGVQQMDAALTEVQRLINYRMQAFESLTPYGVSPTNPAVVGMGADTPAPRSPVPSPGGGPRKGERRKFDGGVLGEWDGEKWVEVKP